VNDGLGVAGENQVYLDLTHKDPEYLTKKLGGILEIYEKFVGVDPRHEPMKIFPAVHYSMGGLWTSFTKGSYSPDAARTKHKSGTRPPIRRRSARACNSARSTTPMTNIPASTPSARSTSPITAPTASAPTPCSPASLTACSAACRSPTTSATARPPRPPRATSRPPATTVSSPQEQQKVKRRVDSASAGAAEPRTNPYIIGKELGDEMTAACTVVRTRRASRSAPASSPS
jgi:hypothetical protein